MSLPNEQNKNIIGLLSRGYCLELGGLQIENNLYCLKFFKMSLEHN